MRRMVLLLCLPLQVLKLRGWSDKAGKYKSKKVLTGGLHLRGFERTAA